MELIIVYNETNRYESSPLLRIKMFLLTSLYPNLPFGI